jgi:hypothetical protein
MSGLTEAYFIHMSKTVEEGKALWAKYKANRKKKTEVS